ncbi:vitelline membrane outer layer protein 1 homolog [Ranitomeya variabilis]|uniref:vitelline membrane outer layer protein 1 homolog n=1 Tax=Ranitomeya variabilis TaxID=490064 RepID=UPI00405740B9
MLPVLFLVTLQNFVAAQPVITVPNGEKQGDWGPMEVCDEGTTARGFQLKVERGQGRLVDDTALNGISLLCTKPSSRKVVKIIHSTVGGFGSWGPVYWCNSEYFSNFSLRVESKASRDSTAANNIKFTCSDGSIKEGNGKNWGSYGPWSSDCEQGINGIQTRVQPNQGFWKDDLSLTDVKFECRGN